MYNKGTPKEKTFCLFCNRQIYGQEMVTEVTQRVPSTPHSNNNANSTTTSPPPTPSLNTTTTSSSASTNPNPLKMSLSSVPVVHGVVHNTCLRKYNDQQKALSKSGTSSFTSSSSASASILNAKGIGRNTNGSSTSGTNSLNNSSANATPTPQPTSVSTAPSTTPVTATPSIKPAPSNPINVPTGRETISSSTANAPLRAGSGSVTVVPRIEITTSTSDMTGQLHAERGRMSGGNSPITSSHPTRSVSPPSPKTRIYSASTGSQPSPTPSQSQSPALSPHSTSPGATSPLRNCSVSALVETFQSPKRALSERDHRERRSSQDNLTRAASTSNKSSPRERERGRSRSERGSEGRDHVRDSSGEKDGSNSARERSLKRGESPRTNSANPPVSSSPNATTAPIAIPNGGAATSSDVPHAVPLAVQNLAYHDLKKSLSSGPISKEKSYYHINIKETGEVTSYIPKTDRDTINDAIRLMCSRRQLNPDDYCCPDFDIETPLFKIVEKRIVIAIKKFSCHLCRKEVFQAEIKRDDGKIFHPICYNKFIKSKTVAPTGFNSKLTATSGGNGASLTSSEPGDTPPSGAGSLSDRGGGSADRTRDANAGAGGKRARRKSLALSPGVLPFLTSSNHRGQDMATPLDRFENDEVASLLNGAKLINLKGCQGTPPNGFSRLILQEEHPSFIIETATERTDLELRLDVIHLDYERLVPYKHKVVFGSYTEKDSLNFFILIIPKEENMEGLLNLNQIILLSSKKYVEWITIPTDVKVKTVRSQLNELLSLNAIDYFKVEPNPTLTKQLTGFCPKFDVHYPRMTIAILYCRGGASDPFEMFKLKPDSHSEGFNKFLKLMRVPPSFSDTLDREYFDVSCFGIKVTYYCCTYLTEEQQRRLIGNTQTVIFFKDDDTPFDLSKTMSMGIVPSVFFVIQRVNELPTAKFHNNAAVAKATASKKNSNNKINKNAFPLLATTNSNGNLTVDEAHPQQLTEALNEAMSASAKGGARARGKSGSLTSGGRRSGHSRENSQDGAAIIVPTGSGGGFAGELKDARERELATSAQLKKTRSRTSSFDGSTPPVLVTPLENVPNIAVKGGSENATEPADSGNAKLRNSKDKKKKQQKNKDRNSAGANKRGAKNSAKSESSSSVSSETLEELDAEPSAKHSSQASSVTPPSHSLPPNTPLPPTPVHSQPTNTPPHSATPPTALPVFHGTRYRVGCFRKTDITHSFLPALPHDSLIPGELSSELVSPLLHFVVAKAHNGLVEASRHPPINVMYEKPREHCLREIVKAHAPKNFWGS